MPLSGLDTAAIARSLSQVAEREGDYAEAYFEHLEHLELSAGGQPGIRVRQERGFALRLVRDERSWSVTGDRIDAEALKRGLRRVARTRPTAPALVPSFSLTPVEPESPDALRRFPAAVERCIRRRHTAFPLDLRVCRHRRWLQVVGTRLVPDAERETYFSCAATLPWGGYGALLADLGGAAAALVAAELADGFAARDAQPLDSAECVVVMAPSAAAVFLHEAVAHLLETDSLAMSGRPEAAVGVQIGSACLEVVEDPATAPPGVRRTSDDEGSLVQRRWLLRRGIVEQLLGDRAAARDSPLIAPGAGRRGGRHQPPVPRSTHLELLPGSGTEEDLRHDADGGLQVSRVEAGSLDPCTGRFELQFPYARRIRRGALAEWTGPGRLSGQVAEVLSAVTAVSGESVSAGAGWCAKDGQKLPVWATSPALRIEAARIEAR